MESALYCPHYKGHERFEGLQTHSVPLSKSEPFINKKVIIVGGGNSGAQILAEVSKVADTTGHGNTTSIFYRMMLMGVFYFFGQLNV